MAIVAAFAVPHPPLIIPAVGGGRERAITATVQAYAEIGRRIAALDPDLIVISSPHTAYYGDYLHIAPGTGARGTFARFGANTTGSAVTYDRAFVRALCRTATEEGLPCGTRGERERDLDWGVLIPLHFIQEGYRAAGRTLDERRGLPLLPCPIVRTGIANLTPRNNYRIGALVQHVADELGRRVVYVASGDLAHKLTPDGPYGFAPEGPLFDQTITQAFAAGDFLALLTCDPGLAERAAECGLRSFQLMAGALDRTDVAPELLSYEGPFGVGYGIAAFTPRGAEGACPERAFGERYDAWHADDMARRRAQEDPRVALARTAIETYVREGRRLDADALPRDLATRLPHELFSTRAGAFVSLKIAGALRGCIGTIAPTRDHLAAEIVAMAIQAATADPRFDPVRADELPHIVYDVDVLEAPERIAAPDQLDPARYGVIVSCADGRRGLLLPDLDGVDTVDEQLRIAAAKGGIDLARDTYALERFRVTRYL